METLIAKVSFFDSHGIVEDWRQYDYLTLEDDLKEGDLVVVETRYGFKVASFVKYVGVTEEYVHVDDLQNLLVPKQKEVKRAQIPEWIIEWYQGANNEFSTLEDVFDNLSHDTDYNIMDSEKFRSRIMEYGGFSKMYEALSHIYFGAYEIEEEEQKYYVINKQGAFALRKGTGGVANSIYTKKEVESLGELQYYQLTEQEIKEYDERYLAFKVPVEEME